jgi:hypothetical protein
MMLVGLRDGVGYFLLKEWDLLSSVSTVIIYEGIAADLGAGLFTWYILPDWPSTTSWLTPEEKVLKEVFGSLDRYYADISPVIDFGHATHFFRRHR